MPVIYENPAYLVTYPSQVGQITMIEVRRENRPKGLRQPYEYILPMKKALKLCADLKKLMNKTEGLQVASATKKSISKGVRLDFFMLGYAPSKNDSDGISKEYWETTCEAVQTILFKYLGNDAMIYAEPFGKRKFQARFETYIMYKEMT